MKTSAIFLLIITALTLPLNAANAFNGKMESNSASKTAVSPSFLKSINVVEERTLEVSDWMLDVNAFEEKSEMIEIEEWMLDVDAFSKNGFNN